MNDLFTSVLARSGLCESSEEQPFLFRRMEFVKFQKDGQNLILCKLPKRCNFNFTRRIILRATINLYSSIVIPGFSYRVSLSSLAISSCSPKLRMAAVIK